MAEEKIKISVKIEDMNFELYLDKNLVEANGGIEKVHGYVKATMYTLYGDLLNPSLKYEINQINILAGEEKLKLLSTLEKGLPSLLN